jgi:hypothetical protein
MQDLLGEERQHGAFRARSAADEGMTAMRSMNCARFCLRPSAMPGKPCYWFRIYWLAFPCAVR